MKPLIFFLLSLIALPVLSQSNSVDTIPFILTDHNNIAIQAILNQQDTVQLMFHTAANSITLTKAATAKMKSIHWQSEDQVKSWGGEHQSRYSQSNLLQIKHLEWDSLSIWENEHSGPSTDGKFGPNLFKNRLIEMDFDHQWILLHPNLPAKAKVYESLPLHLENGFIFLEGVSKIGAVSYTNLFLLHTGYGGSILYDDEFSDSTQIGTQLEITAEKNLKDSFGNVLKTKKAKLPQFKIGPISFQDITVGFFEGAIGRQKMSVMGGDLLKRFNLIMDLEHAIIYLKPNSLKDLPFIDS